MVLWLVCDPEASIPLQRASMLPVGLDPRPGRTYHPGAPATTHTLQAVACVDLVGLIPARQGLQSIGEDERLDG